MKTKLGILIVVVAGVTQLSAATITFDSLEVAGTGLALVGESYTEAGFTITDSSAGSELHYARQSAFEYAGSAGLHSRTVNGTLDLEIAAMGGGTFDFSSIDLSKLRPNGTPITVTFTGFKSGGGTVMASTSVAAFPFTSFALPGTFTNLEKVRFNNGPHEGNSHQFDNLVLTTTTTTLPDNQGTLLIMVIGLVGLAAAGRRFVA